MELVCATSPPRSAAAEGLVSPGTRTLHHSPSIPFFLDGPAAHRPGNGDIRRNTLHLQVESKRLL